MTVNAIIFTELMTAINPPSRSAGAYRIASEIRKAGYTCQVIDFFTKFTPDEMLKVMETYIGADSLIVGFSSTFFEKYDPSARPKYATLQQRNEVYTGSYPYSQEVMVEWIAAMRMINPAIKIVFGGIKTNNLSYLLSLSPPGDAFAIGHCDRAIVEYMHFLEGKNPFFQFEKINDSQIAFHGSRNVGAFDFTESTIDWHHTDFLGAGEAVPIEIGRGCIFSCSFCSSPMTGKRKLEYVKKESVLRDEFLRNYYEFGITRYLYSDDTHNDSVEKLERLHHVVTSLPFELEYAAYLRLDLIHARKDTAVLLRESGARSVYFGIESLYHPAAKSIGKGLRPDRAKETLYWLHDTVWKNEVGINAGFIVGLPNETPDTAEVWLNWLLDKSCPIDGYELNVLMLSKLAGSVWTSDFQRNAAAHGYSFDEHGSWKNEFFTRASANELVNKYIAAGSSIARARCGGWFPIMVSSLGFNPKDVIGRERQPFIENNKISVLREDFISAYKHRLLA